MLLNAALVGWLWLAPGRSTPPQPGLPAPTGAAFLASTLPLSAARRVRNDSLQARCFRQVRPYGLVQAKWRRRRTKPCLPG